jgi:Mg-chelatase subunit ChlD
MRRAIRWLMRGTLLALLVLAGLNPSLPEAGPRRRVYLVDASASTTRASAADAFTPEDALRLAAHDASRLDPDDQVALVAFGAKPVILFPLTHASRVRIPPKLEGVDGSSSDLPSALETAAALAEGGEIVLFSDARSTAGPSPVERIKVPVHTFPLGPLGGVDVSIAAIDAPATAAPVIPITLRITVESTGPWRGEFAGRPIEFTGPGRQDIVMTTPQRHLELRLVGPPDACPENDAATVTVFDETQAPRILIVNSGTTGLAFKEARVARDLSGAADADVIVLERLRADETTRADLDRVAELVRTGVGLAVLGGSSAYALGGWGGTPIEDLLPFWAWPDERSAVVVALDRSGSMSEPAPGRTRPRLEEAIGAVRRALQLAHPDDELALVTFADKAELRCPLVKGSDRGRAAAALQNLSSGGGTALAPALDLAAATVKASTAGRRRIVLVSDGRSESEETELRNIAVRVRDEGIGLTVVRIGDAATPALAILREAGAEEVDGSDFGQLDARLAEALARSRELTLVPAEGLTFQGPLQGLRDGMRPGRVNRVSLKLRGLDPVVHAVAPIAGRARGLRRALLPPPGRAHAPPGRLDRCDDRGRPGGQPPEPAPEPPGPGRRALRPRGGTPPARGVRPRGRRLPASARARLRAPPGAGAPAAGAGTRRSRRGSDAQARGRGHRTCRPGAHARCVRRDRARGR